MTHSSYWILTIQRSKNSFQNSRYCFVELHLVCVQYPMCTCFYRAYIVTGKTGLLGRRPLTVWIESTWFSLSENGMLATLVWLLLVRHILSFHWSVCCPWRASQPTSTSFERCPEQPSRSTPLLCGPGRTSHSPSPFQESLRVPLPCQGHWGHTGWDPRLRTGHGWDVPDSLGHYRVSCHSLSSLTLIPKWNHHPLPFPSWEACQFIVCVLDLPWTRIGTPLLLPTQEIFLCVTMYIHVHCVHQYRTDRDEDDIEDVYNILESYALQVRKLLD